MHVQVDGGQLRYQLYIWLEKEVTVLKAICSYGVDVDGATATPANRKCACAIEIEQFKRKTRAGNAQEVKCMCSRNG